jgi:hypothetical protein
MANFSVMKYLNFTIALLLLYSCKTEYENPASLALPEIKIDSLVKPRLNGARNEVSFNGHGSVLKSGSLEVERGFIWDDTLTNPTWTNNDGSFSSTTNGVGSYSATLLRVGPNRRIYVRAYAKNNKGVTLSDTMSIFTPKSRPRLTVYPADSIFADKAILNGIMVFTGGGAVSEQGFVFALGTINNPTLTNGTKIVSPISEEGGSFSSRITGLLPNTKYNFRCFGTNSEGTSYSTQLSFTTLP